jgi:beta-glucosidase
VSVEVENTGKRIGDEVVQLYIHDVAASVTRPVKELRGFRRVTLAPGQKQKVEFTLTPKDLSFLGRDFKPVVEPGSFIIYAARAVRAVCRRRSKSVPAHLSYQARVRR